MHSQGDFTLSPLEVDIPLLFAFVLNGFPKEGFP